MRTGPRYSMTKTVCHAICGPAGCQRLLFQTSLLTPHTQVFHLDGSSILEAGSADGRLLVIGDHTAIFSSGNAQAVDGVASLGGEALVEVIGTALEVSADFGRKPGDAFPCGALIRQRTEK